MNTAGSKKPKLKASLTSSLAFWGIDTSSYSIGYVAGWSEGRDDHIKQTATRVLGAAHTLIEAITEPPANN